MNKVDTIVISVVAVLVLALICEIVEIGHELEVKQPHINTPHLVWE
jgi:hypothetical protein